MPGGDTEIGRRLAHLAGQVVLALSGQRAKVVVRIGAGISIAVVFAMGWTGWSRQLPAEGSGSDGLTVLYRTAALFVFDASGAPPQVNGLLDFARLLAPLVVAWGGLLVGLTFANRWATRVVARTAQEHSVVIGPPERARRYTPSARRPSVRADMRLTVSRVLHLLPPNVKKEQCECRALHVDSSQEWCTSSGALRARQVIIATGDDATSLAALDRLLVAHRAASGGSTAPTIPQIQIELDNHQLAIDVAVGMAVEDPDRPIDIIDTTLESAHRVALAVCDSPEVGDTPRAVALVGSNPTLGHIVRVVIERLELRAQQDASTPRSLFVVDPFGLNEPVRRREFSGAVTTTMVNGTDELLDLVGRSAALQIAVVDNVPSTAAMYAHRCVRDFPGATVWIASDWAATSERLRPMSIVDTPARGVWQTALAVLSELPTHPTIGTGDSAGDVEVLRRLVGAIARDQRVIADDFRPADPESPPLVVLSDGMIDAALGSQALVLDRRSLRVLPFCLSAISVSIERTWVRT